MAGTPEGTIDEWPFEEEAGEFDAIVGLPLASDERHPRRSSDSQVYVSVSGDARSASWAMGLEEDEGCWPWRSPPVARSSPTK